MNSLTIRTTPSRAEITQTKHVVPWVSVSLDWHTTWAKLGFKYDSQEAWDAVHGLSESFQYYLLKASNNLAMEKGHCEYFGRTKYADGILPIDTYKTDVDEITPHTLNHDWEALRLDILNYGLRHSTLSAQMPSEGSSVVSNDTNGIEPPRDYLSIKKSKKGPLKQIVPQYGTLKNNYTLLWDMPDNTGYINVVAVMQKFFDQASVVTGVTILNTTLTMKSLCP